MPTYILLSTLTPEGRRTLHSDPDRLDEVNQEIADFGCEVIGQYAVLGSCDFVTVIQAPDNESVVRAPASTNTLTYIKLKVALGWVRGECPSTRPRLVRGSRLSSCNIFWTCRILPSKKMLVSPRVVSRADSRTVVSHC